MFCPGFVLHLIENYDFLLVQKGFVLNLILEDCPSMFCENRIEDHSKDATGDHFSDTDSSHKKWNREIDLITVA